MYTLSLELEIFSMVGVGSCADKIVLVNLVYVPTSREKFDERV